MKKMLALCFAVAIAANGFSSHPDEGMWLPLYLKNMNEADMKRLGLVLEAGQIYNVEQSSVKDAIVRLNGGSCTAEIVSGQGLVFTNHHCAYGKIWDAIGKKFIDKKDYQENGFWSQSFKEEIGDLGMSAGLLNYIENITDKIYPKLEKIKDEGKRLERGRAIADSLEKIIEGENEFLDAQVKEMFSGNQYYMYVYKVYRDVRLVASPPETIGKYGGDTDNWMWPRHTGDFAVLRIYADENNEPSNYDANNKPFTPKHFLPVSLKDKKPGDFSMIMGFPGSTERYLTSYDLETKLNATLPSRVETRDVVLDVMEKYMRQDNDLDTRLKSRRAQIANYWKLWSGQIQMAQLYDLTSEQEKEDKALIAWINASNPRINRFGSVMSGIENYNKNLMEVDPYIGAYTEGFFQVSGAVSAMFMGDLSKMPASIKAAKSEKNDVEVEGLTARQEQTQKRLTSRIESYFDMSTVTNKNWENANPHEKELFTELCIMMYRKHDKGHHPAFLKDMYAGSGDDETEIREYLATIMDKSVVFNKDKALKAISKPKAKLAADPFVKLCSDIRSEYFKLAMARQTAGKDMSKYRRLYFEALMKMKSDQTFYPDANSSMRLTYGTVIPYEPRDAVAYTYKTTQQGVLEKNNPNDPEFVNSPKVLDKFRKKEFGRYGKDGDLTLCFLTNHDITGGNSGSPVIDGNGHLIGIAFDGNWEAATSDFLVMPNYNRTISVDIRYVLWTIDELANCDRLIKEMKVIEPAKATEEAKANQQVAE